jgi:tetratricopeptide (TPR) repeat protein
MAPTPFDLAIAALRSGRTQEAEAQCRSQLAANPRHPDASHMLGTILLQTGRLAEAILMLRTAVASRSSNLGAQMALGAALAMSGKPEEAVPCFEKVARSDPKNPDALYNLGLALNQLGRFEDARKNFAKTLAQNPNHGGAMVGHGAALSVLGRVEEALEAFSKAAVLMPADPAPLENLANLLNEVERFDEALTAAGQALKRAGSLHPRALFLAGRAYRGLGRHEEAVKSFESALALHPDFFEALISLSGALIDLNRPGRAIAALKRAIALEPSSYEAYFNLGIAEKAAGNYDAAMAAYRTSLSLFDSSRMRARSAPGLDRLHLGLAICQSDLGDYELAMASFHEAERHAPAQDPNVLYNRAMLLLKRGDIESARNGIAQRWHTRDYVEKPRCFPPERLWNGHDALDSATILVWGEQGVGDQITYASCLPDLVRQARAVKLEVAPKLVPLMRRSFPSIDVRPIEAWEEDTNRKDYDVHIPMADLFWRLRPCLSAFPAQVSYLTADPHRLESWRKRLGELGPGLKVGIGWRSTTITPERAKHFFNDLMPWGDILSVPGVQFVCLQPGEIEPEIHQAANAYGARIHRFEDLDLFNNLEGVAALLKGLDLVITNGSANAILAGSLGVPTWMFFVKWLHWDLLGTEDRLPWIPSLSVYARHLNEGWQAPLAQAALDLSKLANHAP